MTLPLFDINSDGQDAGFPASAGDAITLQLRASPAPGVRSVTFQVWDPTALDPSGTILDNPPKASPEAETLVLDNGIGQTGQAVKAATPTSPVTVTLPNPSTSAWIVRCVLNNGMRSINGTQVFDPSLIHERMVYIDLGGGRRNIVATETTQAGPDGWATAFKALNDLVFDPVGVPRYNLASDLRAVTGYQNGFIAATSAALTIGDEGGGSWVFFDSGVPGTYTDNIGTLIVPDDGDGSGAWFRAFDGAVDVLWFGVSGSNQTAQIQAAIDAASALPNGGTVLFKRLFLGSDIELQSNVKLLGATRDCGVHGLPGPAGYSRVINAESRENIRLENMTVRGRGTEEGLSVFLHNVRFHQCSDVSVVGCLVDDLRGDGIYIEGGANYHVLRSTVDGVTNDNRNGISIIEGEEIWIHQCTFLRLSEGTKPGAIDIEPDSASSTCRNITVSECYFEQITGLFGVVQLGLQHSQADYEANNGAAVNFTFKDNKFGPGITNPYLFRLIQSQEADQSTIPTNLLLEGNQASGSTAGCYSINGLSGVVVNNNSWSNQDGESRVGDLNAVYNLDIGSGERFWQCMGTDGLGIQIGDLENARISCTLDNCGQIVGSTGYGLNFIGGKTTDFIDISEFQTISGSRTGLAVNVTSTHTQADPRNNKKRGVRSNGFRDTDSFKAYMRDQRKVGDVTSVQALANGLSLDNDYANVPTPGLILHFQWLVRVTDAYGTHSSKVSTSVEYTLGAELVETAMEEIPGLPAGIDTSISSPSAGTVRFSVTNNTGGPIYNVAITPVFFDWEDNQGDDPIFKHSPSYFYDANNATESGGLVTDITDAALRGNDISEGTPANQLGFISNWRNGNAACQGATGDRMILNAFNQGAVSQPLSIVIVGEWSHAVSGEIWSDTANGSSCFIRRQTGSLEMSGGTLLSAGDEPGDGVPVIIVAVFNGASSRVTAYPHGESVISSGVGNTSTNGRNGMVLGAVQGGAGNYLRGKVSREVMVPVALSNDDETEIVNAYKAKYSITPV